MNKSWTIFGGIAGLVIGGAYIVSKEKKIKDYTSKIMETEKKIKDYASEFFKTHTRSYIPQKPALTTNYINVENKCINDVYAKNILNKFPKRGDVILSDINAIITQNIHMPHMIHLINMIINLGLTTDILEIDYLKLEREILNTGA